MDSAEWEALAAIRISTIDVDLFENGGGGVVRLVSGVQTIEARVSPMQANWLYENLLAAVEGRSLQSDPTDDPRLPVDDTWVLVSGGTLHGESWPFNCGVSRLSFSRTHPEDVDIAIFVWDDTCGGCHAGYLSTTSAETGLLPLLLLAA